MEDGNAPQQSGTNPPARLISTPDQPVAPVELFAPEPRGGEEIFEILRRALPGMQSSVGVIRNLPRWLEDDMAELPSAIRRGMQEKLDGLAMHAARLDAALRAMGSCIRIDDHQLLLRPIDATPMIEQVVRQRMMAAGRDIRMRIELPEVDTDAELLCGIVGALCDAALSTARREDDTIEIRAIHADGTVRLSALYPGPPLIAGDGASLFAGNPHDGALEPLAGLGLAYVWQAVARLGGRIELGPGFRGVGARITAILPAAATDSGTETPT